MTTNLRGSMGTLRHGNPTPAVTESTIVSNQKIGGLITTNQIPYPKEFVESGVQGKYNQRDSPVILYKGVKICRWFVNDSVVPIIVHWALIQLKQGHYVGEIGTEDGGLTTNFWRAHPEGNQDEREANYTSYANTGSVEELDHYKDCAPMNPDRWYRVLTRKRWSLAAGTGDPLRMGLNVKKWSRYYRINKLVHWRSEAAQNPANVEMPILEVYWTDYKNPANCGSISTDSVKAWSHHTAYFRSKRVN